MNNGLKPPKVNISIEAMPYFSASIADMRITPVTRVVMSVPEAARATDLFVSIVGKCKDVEFLKRSDFERVCMTGEMYNSKPFSPTALEFEFDSLQIDKVFLNSLDQEVMADIYVLVNYAGNEYVAKTHILLLPYNTWLGLEGEPSVISHFVKSDSSIVKEICEGVCEDGKMEYAVTSKKSALAVVKNLYKKLKGCNIIYTRPAGYAANSKQTIRSVEELFGCSSILATPLEIAIIFCSCAKSLGFDTSLLFVRGVDGEIGVLCGVYLVKSPVDFAVYEDAQRLARLIESKDMLVVDPSVFAAAQNTSFVMALENTAENFVRNSDSLVCSVEINKALECVYGKTNEDFYKGHSVKNSVALVYSSLVTSPIMQFLAGNDRTDIEKIPLLLCDFKKAFFDVSNSYKLLPLDININLSDYAAIDKNFSSILTMSSPMASQHFSSSELTKMKAGLERVKERVNRAGAFTTALRDEELYRTACQMTFGKDKKRPYFAYGFVKITDKLTDLVSFAPICLVKAKMEYFDGNFYVKQEGLPVVNKVFIRNALKESSIGYDSFMKSLMPTDKKEIFELFENIRSALKETDDRHIYEIVKETHLVNIDIDDYCLWCNLALERSKLAHNETVGKIFGAVHTSEWEFDKNYVPIILMNSVASKAVICKDDVLIEGAFSEEKEKVFASVAAKSIADTESLLVVTDDVEMSRYAKRVLEKHGVCDGVLVVGEDCSVNDLQSLIDNSVEKYKDAEVTDVKENLTELMSADELLRDYTLRLNIRHSLGLTLKQALESCYSAEDYSFDGEIYVDKNIFVNMDSAGLDALFEQVGDLINETRTLCTKSGFEKYTPVCKHPLYSTRPDKDFDVSSKEQVLLAVQEAMPVISEYRDVFLDVNEILGIDNRELDSMYKLEKLNELYKLVLSARDLDIPEKFVESDIADFSRNKRFISETKKRMEAIENKLGFFNREIFEDVETLLSKNEYEEDSEKGFLKKFMHKRNGQEVLLQYVNFSKKAEFMLNKVSDIYKLLYEYKSCLVNLKENAEYKENVSEIETRLADVSQKAVNIIDEISAVSENEKKKRVSNVFRLISVIPVDANLARKITVVRAKLAELYIGEHNIVKVLNKHLGVDFGNVRFENGVLSFDGIGKYLDELISHLNVLELWERWLQKADRAKERVHGIVEYLEKHGAGINVDKLFAKSLFVPVCQCIKDDVFCGFSAEKLGKAKESYIELVENASEASRQNTKNSYIKNLKQILNTKEALNVNESSLREAFEKHADVLSKLLPVVIVTKNMLTEVIPCDCVFDKTVVFDNKDNGFSMLPAIGFGKKTVVINTSRYALSALGERFKKCALCFDVSRVTDNKDMQVFAWLNSSLYGEKLVCVPENNKTSFELVRMNGIYDRTTSRTNKTEAELSIVKAADILVDETKKVAICAFTDKQCMAIERLARVHAKKNRVIDKALGENRLCITTPDRLYLKEYDSLVVSACFGADRDARIGWDFGYASINTEKCVPEAYIEICDKRCDKVYFLTSLNVKDARFLRRTGNNAACFNSFCEMLSDGRVPVNMSKGVENDDSLLDQLAKSIVNANERFRLCFGYAPIKHALCAKNANLFVFLDNDRLLAMHDELLMKNKLERCNNLVVTLNPQSFAGYDYKKTLDELARDN